jgi:hypothetical protein
MKKLLLIILVFFPIANFAQVKIVLVDGKIINTKLEGFYGEELVFQKKLPGTNIDRVNIMDVDSIIGEMPKSRAKSIIKKNPQIHLANNGQNSDAIYYTPQVTETTVISAVAINSKSETTYQPYQQSQKYQFTAGDYIKRAGTRYVTGLGLAIGGSVIAVVGSESQEAVLAGGIIALTGAIISITGHFELIKAGKRMNSDAVTISPATQGIGMAINF